MLKINPRAKRFIPRGPETDGAGRRIHRPKAWGGKADPRQDRRHWKSLMRKDGW